MSFLKFWGKKDNKHGRDGNKQKDGDMTSQQPVDPEVEKRRLKHSLSISRSGRFKQKNRERGQILDQPGLFDIDIDGPPQPHTDGGETSQASATTTTNNNNTTHLVSPTSGSAHNNNNNNNKSSPRSHHCRDVNNKHSVTPRNMRIGQSVVT